MTIQQHDVRLETLLRQALEQYLPKIVINPGTDFEGVYASKDPEALRGVLNNLTKVEEAIWSLCRPYKELADAVCEYACEYAYNYDHYRTKTTQSTRGGPR